SYTYKLATNSEYFIPSSSSGSFTVDGAPITISVDFEELYVATFSESGLASGTWYINVSTTSQAFSEPYSTTSLSFLEPNNTYSYTAATNYKIDKPSPSSGSFTVSGANVSESITFTEVTYTVTFSESGLASGTWWVNVTTTSQSFSEPSSTSSISFSEPNGTYSYTVQTNYKIDEPSPSSGSFTVSGASTSVSVSFTEVTYTVTFTESGLPSGTSWSVTLNGYEQSSTSTTISFTETNGTYSFTVTQITDYSASPSSGSITVNGAAVSQSITFTLVQYVVTFSESGLPSGDTWTWWVNITSAPTLGTTGSFKVSSPSTSTSIDEVNGTYDYTIGVSEVNGQTYYASPSSGSFTVSGSGLTITITFTAVQPVTLTLPTSSDTLSFWISWSANQSVTASYNGSQESGTSGSFKGYVGSLTITFSSNGATHISVSCYLYDQYQAQQETTTQSYTSSQSITESGNYWNSSISFSLKGPAGAMNNSAVPTTSGTLNAATTMTWTVSNVLSAGYGTSPGYDVMTVTGYQSESFSSPSQYVSWSENSAQTVNSPTQISYSISELINYVPSITSSTVSPSSPSPNQDVWLNVTSSEAISGEMQSLFYSLNGTTYLQGTETSSSSLSMEFKMPSTSGSYTLYYYVENYPDQKGVGNLKTSVYTKSLASGSITLTPSPPDYSIIGLTTPLSLTWSSKVAIATVTLIIDGVQRNVWSPDVQNGSVSYTFSQTVLSPAVVTWTATDTNGYSQSVSFQYGVNLMPSEYSHLITVLQSSNATHSYPISISGAPLQPTMTYPISISGAPSGSGYYQQMITLSNPSQYGINSQYSNFYITTSSGFPLYTWIESANSSSLVLWTKIPDATSSINLEIFNTGANLLSATGYLGEAPQLSPVYGEYDNGADVFPIYYNFAGTSLPSNWTSYVSAGSVSVNNGVIIKGGTSQTPGENGIAFMVSGGIGSPPYIVDYATEQTTSPSGDSWGWNEVGLSNYLGNNDDAPALSGSAILVNFEGGTNAAPRLSTITGTVTNGVLATPSGNVFTGVFTQEITSTTYYTYYNYTQSTGYITSTTLGTTSLPFEILVGNNEGSYAPNGQTIYWFRIRTYLPNGMPTYSIGSGVTSHVQYYQQLFTFKPSTYGINSAGSNIMFSLPNGTNLYAWIQSINSTSMNVWIKVPYGTTQIDMNVYPQFENLFSATGYLGEAPQLSATYAEYDNGLLVFSSSNSYYDDFVNSNSLSAWVSGSPEQAGSMPYADNGLWWNSHIAGGYIDFHLPINFNFNNSYFITYGSSYNTSNSYFRWGYGNLPTYPVAMIDSLNQFTGGNNTIAANAPFTIDTNATYYFYYENGYYYAVSPTQSVSIHMPGASISSTQIAGQLNAGNAYFAYVAVANVPNNVMPTYSIGSPSVFQAAGTTSSSFSGISGQAYNSTWNYFSYNIPVAPSASYVTIIYNSSWLPFNVFPSSYVLFKNDNLITIENVTGYSSVQVSFIEPSQLIGTNTYDTISYNAPPGIVLPSSGYINAVTYQPSGSSKLYTITTTSDSVSIPYGSNVSVKVYNPWRQVVGQISGYQIYNLSSQISIFLNVSQINFQFFNGSPQYVFLSANGYNISFLNSAVVANGSEYFWSTSYYSFSTGLKQYMSGEVTPNRPQVTVDISLNAPPADLEVSVIAYSGSNLGSIGTTGSPRVVITISGNPYSEGSTFIGSEGQTYNIRISTVLGQLLYETNVTLSTSFVSVTEVITVPSYTLGIENEEQVPQSSPLSTEYVSVNDSAGQYYNFTDGVGQNEVLYLLAGNYHIHMKDNLTGNFNISLTQNSQLYAFGQQLLTYQEFQAEMQELANNTAGLVLNTISSPFAVQPQQSAIYQLNVYYTNGTAVTASFLQKATINVLITNDSSGTPVSFVIDHSSSQNTLNVTVIPDMQGNFTISIMVLSGSLSGHVS
ncbi:hypothetical protein, partial [Metallosphaera sp.]|uniref:hypothetical protein n=1 Tax=Metallosphaera sp. TaxID=2020860 RepID=UPI0031818944